MSNGAGDFPEVAASTRKHCLKVIGPQTGHWLAAERLNVIRGGAAFSSQLSALRSQHLALRSQPPSFIFQLSALRPPSSAFSLQPSVLRPPLSSFRFRPSDFLLPPSSFLPLSPKSDAGGSVLERLKLNVKSWTFSSFFLPPSRHHLHESLL